MSNANILSLLTLLFSLSLLKAACTASLSHYLSQTLSQPRCPFVGGARSALFPPWSPPYLSPPPPPPPGPLVNNPSKRRRSRVPPPRLSRKLRPCGGNGGTAWDDGAHGGVRRIYVGQGDSGVVFVKFVYDKGEKMVAGNDHGKKTILGTEEFVLDYPDEYITSVKGRYDKIYGKRAEIITMLRFKTNKRRSPPFGLDAGTEFVLEEKGSKIVGFHGKASDVVHQVGVHVLPISN